MRTLTKYQVRTLKLYRDGKTPNEICKITHYPLKRVNEAIRRAEDNIQRAIEILKIASENGGLREEEVRKLSEILSKS